MITRIGEQKIALESLLFMLEGYSDRPHFPELLADLDGIRKVYADVSIIHNFEAPEQNEVDSVEIGDGFLSRISEVVGKVRKGIVQK